MMEEKRVSAERLQPLIAECHESVAILTAIVKKTKDNTIKIKNGEKMDDE